jgi:hypothetical protein
MAGSSTYSKPREMAHSAAPMTANDALRQLYGDESGDEGPDVEMGDDQVNDFNDFEPLEDLVEPNAAPLTDPDTGGSDVDAEPADTQGGSGERDESEKEDDDSDRGSSHSSTMDDGDKLDRKRQRILARVLPAVMIKRSAQQEMSVMSTCPSTCTNQRDCL